MRDSADDAGFADVRDLYQEVILDRGRHPRHMHKMDPFDASAARDNPMCGDRIEVRVRLEDGVRVSDAAFEARGCAISLASADLMAELVPGHTADDIRELAQAFRTLASTGQPPRGLSQDKAAALEKLLPLSGVSEYPSRIKCATLPWNALLASLETARTEIATEEASSERT